MHNLMRTLTPLYRQSPLPFIAAAGLFSGIAAKILFPLDTYAHIIWLVTLIFCGTPLVLNTIKGIFQKKFSVDIIATLAIITALLLNDTFTGAVIVLMQSGGEAMEKFGLKRAMSTLDALLSRAPKTAIRLHNQQQEIISVQDIQVGDLLLIRPGDIVSVDGTILEGEGEIDDAAITGEPFVRFVKKDARLLSGSILVNGALTFRADKTTDESQYATIVKLVAKAQDEKASVQRLADKYAIIFTPLTLLVAGLGFLITRDVTTVLAVLVVATPCPLILATPIAVLSGINRAAKAGIIVKGGIPLEKIARVNVVVFDKTGTLTQGLPKIEKIVPLGGNTTEDEVLHYAAIVEQQSSHAVAKTITQMALGKFTTLPQPTHLRETPGEGVEAQHQNDRIFVGTAHYIKAHLNSDQHEKFLNFMKSFSQEQKLMTWVAVNGECLGIILFVDQVRPGAKEMLKNLKSLGIKHLLMLTGDNEKNAGRIAKELGITHYHANLHPEDKVKEITSISRNHPYTLMVGDGINDAPALAGAYVGMAMGAQGVAISAQAADIVLLEDNITRVALAVSIGQRMLKIAKQGIILGMGLSMVLMIIAAFGYISPPIGAILQEIIDVAVILNALRARR